MIVQTSNLIIRMTYIERCDVTPGDFRLFRIIKPNLIRRQVIVIFPQNLSDSLHTKFSLFLAVERLPTLDDL